MNVPPLDLEAKELYPDIQDLIHLEKKLGQGSFGTVWKGYFYRDPDTPVAVKFTTADVDEAVEEYLTVKRISLKPNCHPSVICYYQVGQSFFRGKLYITIVMEYIDGVTLDRYMASYPGTEKDRDTAKRLFEGLNFLHSNGVYHRDIKPDNILYDRVNSRLVYVDLGSACFLICSAAYPHTKIFAPADLEYNPEKFDIYALGLSIIYGCLKDTPKMSEDLFPREIAYQTIERFREVYPASELKTILLLCVNEDPKLRPSIKEVLSKL